MQVKSRDGEKIGSVYAFMVNKRTGQAVYAVLTIGGFLGMGKAYYPLPFSLLAFDAAANTYIVTIDRRVLEGGPAGPQTPPFSTSPMRTGCRNITTWLARICRWGLSRPPRTTRHSGAHLLALPISRLARAGLALVAPPDLRQLLLIDRQPQLLLPQLADFIA